MNSFGIRLMPGRNPNSSVSCETTASRSPIFLHLRLLVRRSALTKHLAELHPVPWPDLHEVHLHVAASAGC